MEFLEGVELLDANAVAFGKQGGEVRRAGAESFGLFQQHAMTGKRFAEGAPERHGIALGASLFAQVVVCGQNLSPAVGEGGDCLAMTPAESGAPDFSGDANQRVVVRGGFQAFVGPVAGFPPPSRLPLVPPFAVGDVGRAPLPWAGSATSALPDAPGCPSP